MKNASLTNELPSDILNKYQEIEQIARKQVELLESSADLDDLAEPLQQLGDRRQSCMEVIDAWRKDNDMPLSASDQERLITLIRSALSCDEKSKELLQNIISQTGHKLADVQGMKKANRAYNEYGTSNEAWFIDRKR